MFSRTVQVSNICERLNKLKLSYELVTLRSRHFWFLMLFVGDANYILYIHIDHHH